MKKLILSFHGLLFALLNLFFIQGAPGASWVNLNPMSTARWMHTATLLTNGMVLVAGGDHGFYPTNYLLSSAELFDPQTGMWTNTGSMLGARQEHTATLLTNGQVLVAGGSGTEAEIYDPASGTWTVTGSMHAGRSSHTATLLI